MSVRFKNNMFIFKDVKRIAKPDIAHSLLVRVSKISLLRNSSFHKPLHSLLLRLYLSQKALTVAWAAERAGVN